MIKAVTDTKMGEWLPVPEKGEQKHRKGGGEILDLGLEGCVGVHESEFATAFTTRKSS